MMDDPTDDIEDFMLDLRSWALNTWAWAKAVRDPTATGRADEFESCPASGSIPT